MTDVHILLNAMPQSIANLISPEDIDNLVEIVVDLGRPIEIIYIDGLERHLQLLGTKDMINHIMTHLTEFGIDNRSGIDGTLHRISKVQAKDGNIVGLTCRVGKEINSWGSMVNDIVESGKRVLVISPPGRGKTSLLRSAAKHLSLNIGSRVVIVDTSDEIAGAGYIPHTSVGWSRKLSVPLKKDQHEVLIEAVENHSPEVVIIDEISHDKEVASIRTIAQRGIQVLASVHGSSLEDLLESFPLNMIVGGIKDVTLSDQEALRNGGKKLVRRRIHPSSFDTVIEIDDFNTIKVYSDIDNVVDLLISGEKVSPEIRMLLPSGQVKVIQQQRSLEPRKRQL
jgi:stage III sporulation protein SpoIIIAA